MINSIKCPHCNYQYLPGEIFNPKAFLGQPIKIVRNVNGEILGHEGTNSELAESYNCDNCKKDFNVIAKITFTTESDDISNEESVTKTGLFD